MADRTKWEEAMGEVLTLDRYRPPSEPGADAIPLPNLSVESRGGGRPYVGAGINYGDVGIEGGYQKRDQYARPEYGARLTYRRSF